MGSGASKKQKSHRSNTSRTGNRVESKISTHENKRQENINDQNSFERSKSDQSEMDSDEELSTVRTVRVQSRVLNTQISVPSDNEEDDDELQQISESRMTVDRAPSKAAIPTNYVPHSSEKWDLNRSNNQVCPYCHNRMESLPIARRVSLSPLPWIFEPSSKPKNHICLDDYDEEAVQKKRFETLQQQNSYGPANYMMLTKTKENGMNNPERYARLDTVTRKTVPPIIPSFTPFPDYNKIQRQEKRLNQPYTRNVFAD